MQEVVLNGVPLLPDIQINVLTSINLYQYTSNFIFNGEKHKSWELVYIDFGEVLIVADDKELVLSQQQYFLHKPYELHKIKANNQNCNVLVISFEMNNGENDLLELCGRIGNINATEKQLLKSIVQEANIVFKSTNFFINQIQMTPQYGSLQIIKNYLELFFVFCLRQDKIQKKSVGIYHNDIINSALQYLNDHINEKVTLDSMANTLGYSKSYLSKLFYSFTDKSIIEYFIDMKLDKAKTMLAEEKYTFSDISEILGFSSLQYFSLLFKKKTGYTLTQYNKLLKVIQRYDPEHP